MTQAKSEKPNQNNDAKDFRLRQREFKIQDSLISEKLEIKDVKAAFNLILTFVVYFMIANPIYYYTHQEQFFKEVKFVITRFQHIEIFIMQEVAYLAVLFFVFYPLTKFWIQLRTKFSSIEAYLDIVFAFTIISSIGLFFLASLYAILIYNVNEVMTIAIITEKFRLLMKTQAFILENKRKQEIALEKENKDAKFSSYKQLLYFMFAPTLVYRDEYPRLKKRDYKLLAKLCLQYVITLYFMMVLCLRIFLPTFEKIGSEPIEGKEFIKNLLMVFLAASATCLLIFYTFLHLYTNICCEIFLFGDRRYYDDWWSCTDYKTYYRKWNLLVHDWIYAYLYSPFVHIFKGNKMLAGVVSIYISAVAHEYIIAVALRHVNPILSLLFGGFGVILFVSKGLKNIATKKKIKELKKENKEIKKYFKKEADHRDLIFTIQNILFILSIFNGWFLMISIYAIGYYSKQNCLKNDTTWFTSYSFDCINIRF